MPTYVPRVNEDGNETAGVPSVLMQAPLGTYLGWNDVRSGFFAGQGCGFQGGWIPFAKTKAERLRNHDPRPSLEERYGTLEKYVAIVKRAADQAVRDRFLLPDDAARFVREAEASNILPLLRHRRGTESGLAASSSRRPRCRTRRSKLARAYPAGEFTSGRTFQVPAFCRVAVTAKPTPDSDIKVEVWLPERRGTASCSAPTTAASPARSITPRSWQRSTRDTRPSAPTPATPAIRWTSASAIRRRSSTGRIARSTR